MVKIWSEWNVARLVLPVSAIVVLFWTAGLWTGHNCSYSAILIVFCTFKFSSMSISLSLSFMCIGYCAIELRIYPSWYL